VLTRFLGACFREKKISALHPQSGRDVLEAY
jgi:hypothetical protein